MILKNLKGIYGMIKQAKDRFDDANSQAVR